MTSLTGVVLVVLATIMSPPLSIHPYLSGFSAGQVFASAAPQDFRAACRAIARPELRQYCLFAASVKSEAALDAPRDTRSVAKGSNAFGPAEAFGLSPKSQSDALNRLWMNSIDEELVNSEADRPAWTSRITDEASLGRWQPMRGKRQLALGQANGS